MTCHNELLSEEGIIIYRSRTSRDFFSDLEDNLKTFKWLHLQFRAYKKSLHNISKYFCTGHFKTDYCTLPSTQMWNRTRSMKPFRLSFV